MLLSLQSIGCLALGMNSFAENSNNSDHRNSPIGWICPLSNPVICDLPLKNIRCHSHDDCSGNEVCCFSNCSYACREPAFVENSTMKNEPQEIVRNGYLFFPKQSHKMSWNYRMPMISNEKVLKRKNDDSKSKNETLPVIQRERRTASKKTKHKNLAKSSGRNTAAKNKKKTNSRSPKKNNRKSNVARTTKSTKQKIPKKSKSEKPRTTKKNSKTTKKTTKLYIVTKKVEHTVKPPIVNGSMRTLIQEDKTSSLFHIFHGFFKLNIDVNASNFFNDFFDPKGEKCVLKNWDEEEINIIFIDTLMGEETNPEISGDKSILSKLKQSDKIKNNEKLTSDRQESRVKRGLDEEIKYINVLRAGKPKFISRMVGPIKQAFNGPEIGEVHLYKTEIVTLKSTNTENMAHSTPKAVDVAYESFVRLKPPLRKEQRSKPAQNISEWVIRNGIDERTDKRESLFLNMEKDFSRKDCEKNVQPTEFETSSRDAPCILFENFSNLINLVNEKLLKIPGSHMLLLSKKFDPVSSGKMNPSEFFYRLAEKSLNASRINKNSPNASTEAGSNKIVLIHFANSRPQKDGHFDVLKLKFKASPELKLLASGTNDEYFFNKQVMENCLSVPLRRKSVFLIHFSDNQLSGNTSHQIPIKLIPLNSVQLSKGYPGKFSGTFILQMRKPFVSSNLNRTEKTYTDERSKRGHYKVPPTVSASGEEKESEFAEQKPVMDNDDRTDHHKLFKLKAEGRLGDAKSNEQRHESIGDSVTEKEAESTNNSKQKNVEKAFQLKTKPTSSEDEDTEEELEDEDDTETTNQQSIGMDYWIPEKALGFSILANPEDFHGLKWLKTSTSSTTDLVSLQKSEKKIANVNKIFKLKEKQKEFDVKISDTEISERQNTANANNEYGGRDSTKEKDFEYESFIKLLKQEKWTYSNTEEPLDNDAFIEPTIGTDNVASKRESGQKPIKDNDGTKNHHKLFKLKAEERLRGANNNEQEQRDEDASDAITEKENESTDNSKQKNVGKVFQLKTKSSSTGEDDTEEESEDSDAFIEPELEPKETSESGKRESVKDGNRKDSVQTVFKLKTEANDAEEAESRSEKKNEVENYHGIFRLRKKEKTSDSKVGDLLKILNKIDKDSTDENSISRRLKETCEVLRRKSTGSAENFNGMFRLKTENSFDSEKKGMITTYSSDVESKSMKDFQDVFTLKTTPSTVGETMVDHFQGNFQIKQKNDEEAVFDLENLFDLCTHSSL